MTAEIHHREKIAVLMVHGTNDGAESTVGDKWWQKGSHFSTSLLEALAALGQQASIEPFQWSGQNSHLGRERGAKALARSISALRRRFAAVHIIGHSHGGNVADLALNKIGWGGRRPTRGVASCVTVGTPFLKQRVSAMQVFSAFAFLAIALLGAPLWAAFILERLAPNSADAFAAGVVFGAAIRTAPAIAIPIGITLYVAVHSVRRVLKRRANSRSEMPIHALRHPQDEAIAFLQKVDALKLEPIPKGALVRGSRNLAIAISVQIVVWSALVLLLVFGLGSLGLGDGLLAPFGTSARELSNTAIRYVPLLSALFCLLYLTCRLVFGVVPDVFLRRTFNKRVVNSVRGIAFGADGVERLGDVSAISHTLRTVEMPLADDVVERMKNNAARAASELLAKYRWSLFTAGTDPNASLSELAEDAMTWDSLIHTTYFDQPEVVDMIAVCIAAPKSSV